MFSVGFFWQITFRGGPPPAAYDIFQERIDGVERASWQPTGENEVLTHRLDDDPIVSQRGDVESRDKLLHAIRGADNDLGCFRGCLFLGNDFQRRTGYLSQVILQFPGGRGPEMGLAGKGRRSHSSTCLPWSGQDPAPTRSKRRQK